MNVFIIMVTDYHEDGDMIGTTIAGVYTNRRDAIAWTNYNGPWNERHSFDIECHEVK